MGGGGTGEEVSARLRLPTLTRAKKVITNSFENLRSKPPLPPDKKTLKSAATVTATEQGQSHDLFSRKTSIKTLMSPVHSSSSNTKGTEWVYSKQTQGERTRSWTEGQTLSAATFHQRSVGSEEDKRDKSEKLRGREESLVQSLPTHTGKEPSQHEEKRFLNKTPQRISTSRTKNLLEFQQRKGRRHLSMTPPSSASSSSSEGKFRKMHRRATSHSISSSCRQEIFESVVTPSKMDRNHWRTTVSSDICEPRAGREGEGSGGVTGWKRRKWREEEIGGG